jgi:YidC/Oxa1 family membrane protein insertase
MSWDSLILNPMINALVFLYMQLGGNFGLAIIVFTVIIRLVTFPLMWQSQKSAKQMQDLQQSKAWLDVQKKYAKEKEKLALEQQRLMKEANVNLFGGCWPTLIQFPILIGLYQGITNALPTSPMQLFSLSQRLYPFLPNVVSIIPFAKHFLWMDLSVPDSLPIAGLPFGLLGIPILPILVLVTSWVSQRMIPMTSTDPQQAQTANMMNIFMVIIITQFSLTLPSGLSVYYVLTNLLTIAQFMLMGRVDWRRVIGFGTPTAGAKPA